MDSTNKEILAAKLAALLDYAIPLAKAQVEKALASLETEGAEELTHAEVTELGEELYFLQIQTLDTHEAVAEWEATFPEQLGEDDEDIIVLTGDELGALTVDEFAAMLNALVCRSETKEEQAPDPEVPDAFLRFFAELDGQDAAEA